MASAKDRERKKVDKTDIARLVSMVDKLAGKYSPEFARYDTHRSTNMSCQQACVTNPDKLPAAVPVELLGLWTFQEDPTQEEITMYDHYLARSLPVPIYSPRLPRQKWRITIQDH